MPAKFPDSDCESWSINNAKQASSSSHNHTVGILRRIFKIAIEAGARYDNPALAASLGQGTYENKSQLPESSQFEMLVKEIENSGSGSLSRRPNWCNFWLMAVSAKAKPANITWADCDFKREKIIIKGDPITGLKRRRVGEFREVPMIPEMQKITGNKYESSDLMNRKPKKSCVFLNAKNPYHGLQEIRNPPLYPSRLAPSVCDALY